MKLGTQHQLVPGFRITGAILPRPLIPLWSAQGQLYLYLSSTEMLSSSEGTDPQ